MKTPVVFIIFKRPNTTRKVFEAIRQAKPPKLFVIADGPRPNLSGEAEDCEATRAIIKQVDWNCEVLTNYSDVNLGCRLRVSSGLDWVFSQVEEAIILEDDCLPHPTFFQFCDELLHQYRDDNRVMVVTGNNFQYGRVRNQDSYYFSRYNHCWGWATWGRAWQHYDHQMKLWPKIRDEDWLEDILLDLSAVKFWQNIFQYTYEKKINSWAYAWTFSCWIQNGLSIIPNVNLVSNIGYSLEATHTVNNYKDFANMPVLPIDFPLQHPQFIIRNSQADIFTQINNFYDSRISVILSQKLKFFANKLSNKQISQ
ncbi:glycosyltransferase family 2 protein [aff. Roholtiella sp. LEGE 12411]|uniref:glycosyltransferase family 2 protein n=1 Tax=aff. Roholtiella sp. LEGE 12411 TaxID=1828822 RepID=UPI00187E2A5F|nr:glycosyltransferase family 2 protein [aff. Roholtiella sp. LEGE 12411]MBE9037027.1 glycosyltransferase family 2 protein [aff. Roholtiella sp. LEGE 12411]